jgi:hypothetical protein
MYIEKSLVNTQMQSAIHKSRYELFQKTKTDLASSKVLKRAAKEMLDHLALRKKINFSN